MRVKRLEALPAEVALPPVTVLRLLAETDALVAEPAISKALGSPLTLRPSESLASVVPLSMTDNPDERLNAGLVAFSRTLSSPEENSRPGDGE